MYKPVKHGDTLHMRLIVQEKRQTSKPDRDVVTLKREFVNQHNDIVQSMTVTFMHRCRNAT
ncbi:hypothetical protein [Puniceibacterium confluentis]|uniref:hypothetical protein n=1 Tax=Puniceibacterium confluentis TaxID=1958944 RepID=UPI0011B7A52A|nr:hypothetical protein [Puniceibacterium confluentis]